MAFKIGFISESDHKSGEVCAEPPKQAAPRRSVVQVYFPAKHRTLAYYNDRFDLRQGDLVFVDGKLEGKQGRVEEASYNFQDQALRLPAGDRRGGARARLLLPQSGALHLPQEHQRKP